MYSIYGIQRAKRCQSSFFGLTPPVAIGSDEVQGGFPVPESKEDSGVKIGI